MSVTVYQIKWRVYLKYSCCNFYDFERKCDAEEFLRNHDSQWKMKKVEVELPHRGA